MHASAYPKSSMSRIAGSNAGTECSPSNSNHPSEASLRMVTCR